LGGGGGRNKQDKRKKKDYPLAFGTGETVRICHLSGHDEWGNRRREMPQNFSVLKGKTIVDKEQPPHRERLLKCSYIRR